MSHLWLKETLGIGSCNNLLLHICLPCFNAAKQLAQFIYANHRLPEELIGSIRQRRFSRSTKNLVAVH